MSDAAPPAFPEFPGPSPSPSPTPPDAGGRPGRRSGPGRQDLVDVAFAVVLAVLGVIGFDASFGGTEAFTVGIPAVLCGAAVGYLVAKWRPPLLVGAATGVVAFFALGGAVALRGHATAGLLPNPDVWEGLANGAVNGWWRLLTTQPPAGQAGYLLTIPYLVGLVAGFVGVVAALLVVRWPVCVLPSVAAMALSVLFGLDEPAALALQGGAFGAVTIAWLSVRSGRRTRPDRLHGERVRLVGSVALLAVAALGALVVGPHLPFADAQDRYILRDRIEPPFDPSQYPSPLGRFRVFHGPEERLLEGTLLTVEGLPPGEVVRFAVMDAYDGWVWRASPPGTRVGGTYHRVGDRIADVASGPVQTVRFEMGQELYRPDSVWVPTAGSPRAIRFSGPRGQELTEAFRFNRTVEAAASPDALRPGDRWEVDAAFPEPFGAEELSVLSVPFEPAVVPDLPEQTRARVQEWTEQAESPYEKATAIATRLREVGAYDDGDLDVPTPGGHSLARVVPFLEATQPKGNGEQYAAAAAYLASAIGIPARVVLVFENAEGDEPFAVQAEHLQARVEIALQGVGWVPIEGPTPPEDQEPDPEVPTPPEDPVDAIQPPPPTTVPPAVDPFVEPEPEVADVEDEETEAGSSVVLGILLTALRVLSVPVLLLVAPALVVVALKARRRRRRRTSGPAARRVAAAWAEVTDLARDLGRPVPPKATRHEIAQVMGFAGVDALAAKVDGATFGAAEPDDRSAAALWSGVDRFRKDTLAAEGRLDRLRARTSLSSLRATR